jgi:hypothetical protein
MHIMRNNRTTQMGAVLTLSALLTACGSEMHVEAEQDDSLQQAVINGEPDGSRHPYVCASAADNTVTGMTVSHCSAVLIRPRVLLTAGHCNPALQSPPFVNKRPTCDTRVGPVPIGQGTINFLNGIFVRHPDPGVDIGLWLLDDPVTNIVPARLPKTEMLLHYPGDPIPRGKGVPLTFVGRGLQQLTPPPPPDGFRHQTQMRLGEVGPVYFSAYPDPGFAWRGDSGGPYLLGDSDTVIGIAGGPLPPVVGESSTGARTDTAVARSFIESFIE